MHWMHWLQEFAPLTAAQEEVLVTRALGGDHSNFLADPEERKVGPLRALPLASYAGIPP